MRGTVALALLLVVAAAAGGCGSTMRQVTAHTVGGDGELGLDGSGEDAVDGGAEGGSSGPGGAAGGGPGGAGSTGNRSRTGSGPGGSDGGGDDNDGSVGPGVTDTELKLGIVHNEGTDSMSRQFGTGLGVFGDFRAYYEIAINQVNAKGGILGRKIKPVFRAYDATRSDTSVQEQSNCDALTRDTKVFAVLAPSRQSDTFRACIQRAGVVYVAMGGSTPTDARTYTQFSHYVEGGSLNLSRLAELLTDQLVAEGFFGPDAVIGVATFDDPSFRRAVERQLRPALGRHGLQIKEVLAVPQAANSSEQGGTSAAIKSGVLRFQELGINRVIFIQNGVTLPLLFMSNAASSGYTPRYALNSSEAPQSLQDTGVPQSQFNGAVGLSWLPSTDVKAAEDTVTATQKACTDLMVANGQRAEPRSKAAAMYAVCDQVGVFAGALAQAGRPHRKAFITGLEALGFTPALTYVLDYAPDRHDGVAAVRTLKFVDECKCFRFTSGVRRV